MSEANYSLCEQFSSLFPRYLLNAYGLRNVNATFPPLDAHPAHTADRLPQGNKRRPRGMDIPKPLPLEMTIVSSVPAADTLNNAVRARPVVAGAPRHACIDTGMAPQVLNWASFSSCAPISLIARRCQPVIARKDDIPSLITNWLASTQVVDIAAVVSGVGRAERVRSTSMCFAWLGIRSMNGS